MVNLRILIGFAFVPAGLKKVLKQPFTDPNNVGPFHDFLHAFHATGFFYQFVGITQLTVAVLLMTQRFATVGAMMALPVFTAINVFCWSTDAIFTACMVSLMLLGTIGLVLWDYSSWRWILPVAPKPLGPGQTSVPLVRVGLWRNCGAAILLVYFAICLYSGGIYRPVGVELGNPAFYTFPLIAMFPLVTLVIDSRRRAHSAARDSA